MDLSVLRLLRARLDNQILQERKRLAELKEKKRALEARALAEQIEAREDALRAFRRETGFQVIPIVGRLPCICCGHGRKGWRLVAVCGHCSLGLDFPHPGFAACRVLPLGKRIFAHRRRRIVELIYQHEATHPYSEETQP